MNSFFDRPSVNLAAIFKLDDVSEKTQTHLVSVYRTLAVCAALSALGMYMNAYTVFVGFISNILVLMGMLFMICKILDRSKSEGERCGYLYGFAFG